MVLHDMQNWVTMQGKVQLLVQISSRTMSSQARNALFLFNCAHRHSKGRLPHRSSGCSDIRLAADVSLLCTLHPTCN